MTDFETFLHLATHDLKEPARKISTFGQRLQRELEGNVNEKAEIFLSRMIDASLRMQETLDKLSEFCGLRMEPALFENLDSETLIKGLRIENIDLEMTAIATLKGDRIWLVRLFQELIDNTLKFSEHRQPHVTISLGNTYDSQYTEILFTDNGPGIDPEFVEDVFLPFKKLHGKSEYPGVGMGLALCRKIAEIHGGSITINPNYTNGLQLKLTLPSQ